MSKTKLSEWEDFNSEVRLHIMEYVVPQYGDYPDSMIEGADLQFFKNQLDRYVKRIGSNARGIEEAKRDALKIAHYGCFIHTKLSEGS